MIYEVSKLKAAMPPEWRVTRPGLYPAGCPGHNDPGARQGHYVRAWSAEEAALQVAAEFKDERLEVQSWH